ncbi:MAG: alpha/beta fold hydrolase [Chloroflexi bacterium]|nr:MAG: alpha/beta fold hydrolase [Chloroflexota bacterium]
MESRTITVEGLRTRVLDENVDGATGDPILLVHGVGGWAENWRAVIRPLAASRRRVVALDLPGFGASARPGRVRYFSGEKAFYPRFVLGAMDVLGISRAHLGGQSMGGAIVAITAVTAPERVRSMMLVAPGGLGREVALYLRLCALPGMGLVARLPRSPSAARAALESCYFDVSRITPELYAEAERYGGPSFPEFVRALAQGLDLGGVRRALRDEWVVRSPTYRGPALVVWGREDRVLPIAHLDSLPELLPQAEVRIVERCGHLAMAECPDEFLDAALPFLDRAERMVVAGPAVSSERPRARAGSAWRGTGTIEGG